MTMDLNKQKELFSLAYIRAVAVTAGLSSSVPDVDLDSVDLELGAIGGGGFIRSPKLAIQAKCSAAPSALSAEDIPFRLPAKNYHELRHDNYAFPRILVLVVVPETPERWLRQTPEFLELRHCGYWLSLLGRPDTSQDTITVHVPRSQIFTVEALTGIMERIRRGDQP